MNANNSSRQNGHRSGDGLRGLSYKGYSNEEINQLIRLKDEKIAFLERKITKLNYDHQKIIKKQRFEFMRELEKVRNSQHLQLKQIRISHKKEIEDLERSYLEKINQIRENSSEELES